jgi:predicted PurR-regulated permease PerM
MSSEATTESVKHPAPVTSKAPQSRMLDAPTDLIPEWLRVAGIGGWLVTGIAVAVVIAAWLLATSASISVPLLLAIVLGIVFAPVVDWLEKRRVPRMWATSIVVVALLGTGVATTWIVIRGFVVQWPAISQRLQAGIHALAAQLANLGWDVGSLQSQATASVQQTGQSGGAGMAGSIASGVFGAVSAGLSGTIGFLFGLFIATVLLFYMLADYAKITDWTAEHMMGLPRHVGLGLIDDASFSLRGYVKGTTLSGFFVALTIAAAALFLKVPLVGAIFIVTFLTCYIPFFGAIISSVFAFVIALGGTGFSQAVILLLVVLIAQNVLQTVINAKFMGESLELHPLVVLVVTMLGGVFGGLLGATLAAPLTALAMKATKRIGAARAAERAEREAA